MDRILFVDDHENLLLGLQRSLRSSFQIDIALRAEEGLSQLARTGYAVVVSDLQMPGMNGIRFLARVKERYPETVRLMLSGNADMASAIEAVNEGQIFQFLVKPCPAERIGRALEAALAQHNLLRGERDLLERTLAASLSLMTETLGRADPAAFEASCRIRGAVRHMARSLGLGNVWEFDLAAMLSQIGLVAVPAGILEKVRTGQPLSTAEQETMNQHPAVAGELLSRIPRLEAVAAIVRHQQKPFDQLRDRSIPDTVAIGAQMLHIARQLDEARGRGANGTGALRRMAAAPETFQPALVAIMMDYDGGQATASGQLTAGSLEGLAMSRPAGGLGW